MPITAHKLQESDGGQVSIFGPASLSNLGPGFDTMGLCIRGLGDIVEARLTDTPGIEVRCAGKCRLPTDPLQNTASRAALMVLKQARATRGMALTIRKGIPLGSGVGGSAASAVAGAWAANLLLGAPFDKAGLVEAVLDGEAAASGGVRHGDNALPALFGGLVLSSPVNPSDYRNIPLARPLPIALLLPRIKILTSEARRMLPSAVPFSSAVENASDLSFLVHAFATGDWDRLGPYMMRDRFVEPVRAGQVPCYEAVREAALSAGAYGCALTGSGPAMFAMAPTRFAAEEALEAMLRAADDAGVDAGGFVTEADGEGVRQMVDEQ